MDRTEIINSLIKKNGYKKYLEIGVESGQNIRNIECDLKHGVDPNVTAYDAQFHLKSDEFFDIIRNDMKYDIIFIDGMHTEEQVLRDVDNAIKHLTKKGVIVLHDSNPPEESFADPTPRAINWCGTVYKAVWKLRRRSNLTVHTVDCDFGCAIIQVTPPTYVLKIKEFSNWTEFDTNRKTYLGLITEEEFTSMYISAA